MLASTKTTSAIEVVPSGHPPKAAVRRASLEGQSRQEKLREIEREGESDIQTNKERVIIQINVTYIKYNIYIL